MPERKPPPRKRRRVSISKPRPSPEVGEVGRKKTPRYGVPLGPVMFAALRTDGDGRTEALAQGATLEAGEAKYRDRRRAEEARLTRATAELGGTEESRLRWLLAFVRRPLRRLPDEDWAVLHTQLRYLAPHHPGERHELLPWPPDIPGKSERRLIVRAQQALGECLNNLAEGREYECAVPAGRRVFSPPQRRGNGRSRAVIGTRFFVRGPAALIHAAVDMLEHVGADRLKRCPFPGSAQEPACGRLFLAEHRNQAFCSRRHATRAAYLKWWRETKGGTRAKQ